MNPDEPGSLGAATAPGADGPLGGLIAAIQARDGERIIAEMDRLADQLGTGLPAVVHTTPDAGRLIDEMLDVLSGRARALDTAGAWLQLSETAVTLGRDTLADEAAATALRRDPQSHGAPLLRAIIANRPGDHESALRTITELAAQVPASRHELTVILQFALAQLGVKRPEAALAALDTAWPRFTAGGLGGYTARDMVEELAALPLEFSPGTRWNYSVSTDVIGHLIELISGQRLDAYLREHVLQPLGMTDTSFVVTEEQSTRFAANYQRLADDSLKLIDHPVKSIYRDCAFFSGGGGLVATANDYSDGRRSSS